ncbi:MAG: hypothetical protein Q9179_002471 [Wetmoreana sp. 5 TL-2023]
MPSLVPSFLSFTLVATIAVTASSYLEPRAGCSDNYKKCSPKGAASTSLPTLGTDLSPLYTDLVNSVQGAKKSKRGPSEARDEFSPLLEARDTSSNLCCKPPVSGTSPIAGLTVLPGADGTQCLLLQGFNLPFCYVGCNPYIRQAHSINRHQDNYTTNYLLPDGATGQIVSGEFSSTNGQANLITGNYTLSDGTKGNVYGSEDSPSKPDTATLPIPTQYTAAGSGNAIPATALGQVLTITTTIPGTTVAPSTIPAETIAPTMSGTSTIGAATTKPASTIPGTTLAAKTSVYTTTLASAGATAKGAGAANSPNMSGAAGFGFLLYAVFGL